MIPCGARASSARPATSPPAVVPAATDAASAREAGNRQRDAGRPWRAERERDGHRADSDAARAEEQPEVAAEGVVEPAAAPGPDRHAEGRDQRHGAEDAAHGALAEILAHEDRVE